MQGQGKEIRWDQKKYYNGKRKDNPRLIVAHIHGNGIKALFIYPSEQH